MEIEKETPITVQSFHYDLNEKNQVADKVNVALTKTYPNGSSGGPEGYFQVDVVFKVAPEPGAFTVSGQISQIVHLKNYSGDGQDLKPEDYKSLSRPLVEYIETLTYEVTQVTMPKPVNLSFTSNFK